MQMSITLINYRRSKIVVWQSLVMILAAIFLIRLALLNRVLKRLALRYPSPRLILLRGLFFELLYRSMICWHFSNYFIPRVSNFSCALINKLMSHISKWHLIIVFPTLHILLVLADSRLYLFLCSWV
jgi:hypothetical protein